ncbi:MAG TPA: serine hydrolase domain-containing protein [Actinophytocola sp.]|nr:serine hydrolase domain-containing protein [Actinophytocola sp.]
MRGLPRRVVAAAGCVVAMLLAAGVSATAATPAQPDAVAIDRFLAAGLDATGLPGMAVAVTHGADVVHIAGYGTDGRGRPVTPRTPFRIGSLTKSFTAAAVLQLVEAERVDLDAAVQTYLPGFTTSDAALSQRITVRQLLNQTSGISDTGFAAVTDTEPDLARRVAGLREAGLVSEPGTAFHYSDLNYQVLARLIEVVSGAPWGVVLRQRVFAPLGMGDTVAAATAGEATEAVPGLAPGHVLVFGMPVDRPELDGLLAGSGGVVSTAEDMARWLRAQATGAVPMLSPASVALMQTPPSDVVGRYGMGWQVVSPQEGPRRIEHNGILSTFSADQVLLPDSGYGFALLYDANSALADTAGLKVGLAELLVGDASAGGPRSTSVVAGGLGAATLAVLALRVRLLLRIPCWRRRWAGRRRWTAVPGLVWLVLPVGLLAAMPALMRLVAGRSFTFWQLCLAMPDPVILLAVAGLTGTAVAAVRLVALVRPD